MKGREFRGGSDEKMKKMWLGLGIVEVGLPPLTQSTTLFILQWVVYVISDGIMRKALTLHFLSLRECYKPYLNRVKQCQRIADTKLMFFKNGGGEWCSKSQKGQKTRSKKHENPKTCVCREQTKNIIKKITFYIFGISFRERTELTSHIVCK